MNYILLFLEGIITFISPCILPMVPIYISYFMGDDEIDNKKNKAIVNSIGFVFGFSFIFTLLGTGASVIGLSLNNYIKELNIISGIVMIVFGLNHLGVLNIKILQRSFKIKSGRVQKGAGITSSILFGVVFGIGWTPCVGPFLGSALMLATNSDNIMQGVLMLLTYSLGLGIPFILSTILIDSLKSTFDFIKRNYKIINRISGVILIIVGIMMITGYLNMLLSILTFN